MLVSEDRVHPHVVETTQSDCHLKVGAPSSYINSIGIAPEILRTMDRSWGLYLAKRDRYKIAQDFYVIQNELKDT